MNWKEKFLAAGIHLGLSAFIAALAAVLVFAVWYPYPYREISGGRELFLLVVGVDVVLGPLITLVIFNQKKPRTELARDLAVVVLIQLSALCYGLWTVSIARPVHLVFEIDRFRVVHAVDIDETLLPKAPEGIRAMPLWGPSLLAVRPFKDSKESFDATMAALSGADIGARPELWMAYSSARAEVLKASKPVADLQKRFPEKAAELNAAAQKTGRPAESLAYVPMVGRNIFWTVLVDPGTADVVGFVPLDPF